MTSTRKSSRMRSGKLVVLAMSTMTLAACTGSMSSPPPRPTRATEVIHLATQTEARVTPTAVTGAAGYLWLLGTYPCETGSCPVLTRSTDGGKSFVRVGTPPPAVATLDFANREDGYAYDDENLGPNNETPLYWTRDGGKSWRPVPSLGLLASPIVTANGRAFVAVYRGCSENICQSLDVASSAVTGDSWTVKPLPLTRHAWNFYEVGLTAFGSNLWVAVAVPAFNGVVFFSEDGGHDLSVLPTEGLEGLRCDLSATSPAVLWGFCITGLLGYFVRSSDGGRRFLGLQPPGEAANSNDYLALSDDDALLDVEAVQHILMTKNGGRTFVRLSEAPKGVGVADIVPLSATNWFAQGSSGLWRTTNDGRSWQPVEAPTVGAAASVASCKASQLTVGGFGTSGAAGHAVVTIRVGNTSAVACSLRGYPVVTFLNYAGAALRVTVSHVGVWPPGVATVVLPPGRRASAGFIIISGDTSATPCPMASSIRVKLPDMAASFGVDTAILVPGINLCGSGSPVDISPIVKGALLAVSPPVLLEAEFPTTFYPDPEKFPGVGGYPSGCPDLAGVTISTPPSREVLAKLLDRLGGTIDDALLASDPSYWSIIFNSGNWARFHSVSPAQLVIARLIGSGYVELAQRCGKATVSHLWLGQVCSGRSPFVVKGRCRSPALATEVLFLNRSGRWLVVYTYP